MDKYKIKDYTERLKKETTENAHKMLYMWIKQDVISLSEYKELLNLHSVSGCFPSEKEVEEAAESFADLYMYEADFARGREAGWNAGANWMKEKYKDTNNR